MDLYRICKRFRFRIRSKNRLKIAQNRNISLRVVQNPPESVKKRYKSAKTRQTTVNKRFKCPGALFLSANKRFRSLRSRKFFWLIMRCCPRQLPKKSLAHPIRRIQSHKKSLVRQQKRYYRLISELSAITVSTGAGGSFVGYFGTIFKLGGRKFRKNGSRLMVEHEWTVLLM